MCEIILEDKIENLANAEIDKQEYSKPGVWALYGRKLSGKWECLEVAKTADIYREIQSAIYILITPDDERCKKCNDTYCARRRFKNQSAKFRVHKCKDCSHTSKLRIVSWKSNPRYIDKYKDMINKKYIDFKFVCINKSENMCVDSNRIEIEKEFAKDVKALYWWG